MDLQGIDEDGGLLQNGILLETNKGYVHLVDIL